LRIAALAMQPIAFEIGARIQPIAGPYQRGVAPTD
jgi:hypothetical protein